MSKKWDFPVRKSNREKLSTKIQGERKVSKADELRRKAEAAKAHAEALAAEAEAEAAREAESKNISPKAVDKAVELLVNLEQAKAWYGELDEIIDDMIESGQDTFESSDGVVVTLVDNFATKNKRWKQAAFKRFDLQLIETKFGRKK
jgi:nucleoid-associated protein YgaU